MKWFFVALFITSGYSIYSQQNNFKQLTLEEYYSDFDSLQKWITSASPIYLVNDKLKGQDFLAEMKSLRMKLATVKTNENFYKIVFNVLNLLQDPHASLSTNKSFVSPVLLYPQKDTNYIAASCQFYDSIRTKAVRTGNIKPMLPIAYLDGKYVVYYPFTIGGVTIDTGFVVTAVNETNVHQLVKKNISEITLLKYDFKNKRSYYEYFYRLRNFYDNPDSLVKLQFSKERENLIVKFSKKDTAVFDKKISFIGFNQNMNDRKVIYIDSLNILYIRMPQMTDGAFYINELKKFENKKPAKVILDIRGNGGGQDWVWASVLKKIIKDSEIVRPIYFGIRNNDFAKSIIRPMLPDGDEIKGVIKMPINPKEEFYTLQSPPGIFYGADSSSMNFEGNIYLLCSGYEYSSTGNLIDMALPNSRIISVGQSTGLLGGLDLSPVPFMLPHSKIIFNLAVNIDFKSIANAADFYHNKIEVPVNYTVRNLYNIASQGGDISDMEFLLKKDPMFKKVKSLK